MEQFEVVARFRQRVTGRIYEVGETFPQPGEELPADYVEVLLTGENRYKTVYIKEKKAEEKPAPKRRRKKKVEEDGGE